MQTIAVDRLLSWTAPPAVFSGEPPPPDQLIGHGLITPLPVRRPDTGSPELVWGTACARRAGELGVLELPVRVLPDLDRDCFLIALWMESRVGRYSWADREAIYRFAEQRSISIDNEVSRLVTGDGGYAEAMARYLALSAGRRSVVADGLMDLRTAVSLGALPDGVVETVGALRMSFSNRRQVLTWLAEITARDRLDAGSAVDLAVELTSQPDPVTAVRLARYPRLSAMEAAFASIRSELREIAPVAINAPAGFEGDGFELVARLCEPRDIHRVRAALDCLQEKSGELFDLL